MWSAGLGFRPPRYLIVGQTGRECKMAHSCRWRFPARPGGSSNSGTGRRAGRIRVTAFLRSVSGTQPNAAGLGPGFDAALQVSSVIGSNLQKFREVLGESSDSSSAEDEAFVGFGATAEQTEIQSPSATSPVPPVQEKKPRGRPPRVLTAQKVASSLPSLSSFPSPTRAKPDVPEQPAEKVKRLPGRPPGTGEKRRGRPPSSSYKKAWSTGNHAAGEDSRQAEFELGVDTEDDKDRKGNKRLSVGSEQPHVTEAKFPKGGRSESKVSNLKRLTETKITPLKSHLKTLPGVPRRRRGRPPSAERLKAEAAAAAAQLSTSIEGGEGKHKTFRVRGGDKGTESHTTQQSMLRNVDGAEKQDSSNPPASPSPSKPGRPVGLRKSPRHRKPVRIVPPSKRTDATIAKQLLQRAKKGAQKRLEKEAIGGSGSGATEAGIRKTQLKNIRQFIMPVVSTVSLRIIKTPKRFIQDEGSFGTPQPHTKIARLEPPPSFVPTPAQPTSATSSSPSPALVSVTPAASSSVTTAPVESLPPPSSPAPTPAVPAAASSLLNSNTSNAANGRFSHSAPSCGSSAVSQHSSQLSSAESSRSSSPSLDDSSCDSQASEATQALSEPEDQSLSSQGEREANLLHSSRPASPPSEPEPERSRRGRRAQGAGRGSQKQRVRESLPAGVKKPLISPPTGVLMSSSTLGNSQQTSSTASSPSSPPPPPLLAAPQPPLSSSSNAAAISEHHAQSSWMPQSIPTFMPGPSVLSSLSDKRSRSILREPTFRWTSLSHPKQQYFSSAKYAKEGLIRKPIFDNFRPPPLTPEDVGMLPGAGGPTSVAFPTPGAGAGSRLFAPIHTHHQHPPSSRFEASLPKRSPLLRAPRFTPSEAHSRIFESVTLQSSSGSSPGSLSPHQTSPSSRRPQRRSKRQVPGAQRGHPRSPSHSMTRRSSQTREQMSAGKGASEMSVLTGSVSSCNSSSLPGVSASPLANSALTPATFSPFSTVSRGLASQGTPDSRRGAAGTPSPMSNTSSASSPLFPLFPSSAQDTGRGGGKGAKEKSLPTPQEPTPKEKERESERNREKEKENKREGRKEFEKRSKVSTPDGSPNAPSSLFAVDGRDSEGALAPKKAPGRKKSTSVDTVSDTASLEVRGLHSMSITKGRQAKKGRASEKGAEAEEGEKEKEKRSTSNQQTANLPGQQGRQNIPVSLMVTQAEQHSLTDRQLVGLLKKAKDQLIAIKKNKLKPADQTKVQGQESDSSEASVRGPRIKHVCRRAAVALGRNRAVFPDDMPTLSALPWEEREKILSSMGNDDKSSVAGSEEAEPQSPPIKPREMRQKVVQEAPPKKGRRSRRCGQCSGCQVPEDCGVCTNCLDKPKFGGRNIKKQCCKMRKCQNLQWMPSKMILPKQGKGKKDKKKRFSEKKEGLNPVKGPGSESGTKPTPASPKEDPQHKNPETPPLKLGEEKSRQQPQSKQPSPALASSPAPAELTHTPSTATPQASSPASPPDPKQLPVSSGVASKKGHKPQQPVPAPASTSSSSPSSSSSSSSSPSSSSSSSPAQNSVSQSTQCYQLPHQQPPACQTLLKKDASPKTPVIEPKKKPQHPPTQQQSPTTTANSKLLKKQPSRTTPLFPKQKPKDKLLSTKPPSSSTLNSLSTPSTRELVKSRAPCDGVHRIRVDFKRDQDVEKVWEAGGLSLLTSVPITPRVLCFLCASSGDVEFVFCQVCCEPFHLFCLGESERPLQEQFENWCCRRCRFCQACGRQHQKAKQQLLECDKCRNSYHPECLGPNYPTRPTKKNRVWICIKCVRCKSCGATKPGKSWDAQWSHDFSMCHDCAKLFAKGNFCPLCDKHFDDDDYDSKTMKCCRCNRWVHAKCEKLTDEMYGLLSALPESVAYTCTKCTERYPAKWRTILEREFQCCIRNVLNALLNSRTSTHLLRYRQAVKPPELNPETEESLPSRRSPEGPDPPVLTEVAPTPPSDSPPDFESIEKKMDQGRYYSLLEFSDDIVRIIQTAISNDGGQPESRKANSMVKSFFIRQMDRIFPWFKVKESRFWERQKVSANSGLLPNAVLPPSLDHNYAQWQERQELCRAKQPHFLKKIIPAPQPKAPGEPDLPAPSPPLPPSLPPPPALLPDCEDSPELPPPPDVTDNRQCVLCLKYGDENTNECGRLLYIGQNEWAHVNCALWSADVFEDDDGSLKNVHTAVHRGRQMRCEKCEKSGATVSCCLTSCNGNYHFMCARQSHCVFLEDKKVYCSKHRDLIKGDVVSGFEVTRRVLVDLEGISLRRKWLAGLEPENVHMMIGSMTIDCLGILTELSDCKRKLFPVGYQCSRVYWSTLDARKRCVYTCRILVCHSPVTESDLKSVMPPEENRTIAHSPPPTTDVPDPFKSPRRSENLSPANTPKLRVYTRNRHPSYPPCQRSIDSKLTPPPGVTSQLQSHAVVTVRDSLLNSRNIDARRHSSPSLSSPPHQLNRQRGVTASPQASSRPLTSPPPLIPSPARDPEKSKHISRESSKNAVQRDDEKVQLFSTDRHRPQPAKEQALRDADKGRTSSRDHASKDSDKSRPPREQGQKDSDKSQVSAKEPEKRRLLSPDSGLKESESGRPLNRDHSRDSEKGRQTSRELSTRDTNKSKSSSRNPSYKDMNKSGSLSRDTGVKESEKHKQYSRETGKDSGQGKERPSSRDSDKGRPSSRDSSYRNMERNKESGSGRDGQSKRTENDSRSPRLVPAGSGQSSPPVGTAVHSGQQRSSSTKQVEKQGKHEGKDQDLSPGLSLMPCHRPTHSSNVLPFKDKPSSGKESSCATGNIPPSPLHKDSAVGKSGSPQKSSTRKANNLSSGLAVTAAGTPTWSSRTSAEDDAVKQGSLHLASPAAGSAAKDKHPKVKTAGSRDASKDRDREKSLQNSNSSNRIPLLNNNTKAAGSSNTHTPNPSSYNNSSGKTQVLGNSTKAHGKPQGEKHENQGSERSSKKSNYSCPERKNSSSLDSLQQLQQASLAPEKGVTASNQSHTKQTANQLSLSSREKKRSVKPSPLAPLKSDTKTDPNGTNTVGAISSSSCHTSVVSTISPAGQGAHRSAHTALFSSPSASSSDSSESDTQTQTEEDDLLRDHRRGKLRDHHGLLTRSTEDDGPEEDRDRSLEDKHHEDDSDGSGSAKRRYPRRSARARSNMFFGLTPFYGVRSYGEEDLPFYAGGDGAGAVVRKRAGSRKKSAEGQVDGADDMSSSSSSGDSGEDEDSGVKNRSKDSYYYNFTRTIINPGEGLPSIEGLDHCLGRGSQLQRFLKDEEQQQQRTQEKAEEDMLSTLTLGKQRISQLDGVDDGSESDTSICTTSATTTTATSSSTPHKSAPKRRGRERLTDKTDSRDSSKEADSSSGAGSGSTRESRKNHKENCLALGGGVKAQPQSQGQDPLEAQLSLSTDLLKSDSDNNNSDDCGNILPSDIMEFVLNTPSMSLPGLGQQSESSSSELLLDESYVGVDVNRRKDILFEDFSQPLPSAESGGVVESNVNSSISVEEPYLPLELPSDLSVLTTRSPTVSTSQNHTAGSLISNTSDRSILGLNSDPESISGEKSGDKKGAGPGVSPSENQLDGTTLGNRDTPVSEGHMTPEQFISSPAIGQVVETPASHDVSRSSGTSGLPSSPSVPLQSQKYLPASTAATGSPSPVLGPGPSQTQVSSPTVIKPGPDKLIVVNQQFQPLYVLQTVPNGVTQKISATGVMDPSSPAVLSSMTLTSGLNASLTSAQPIFPAGGKVLGTIPHPSQIHAFAGSTQAGFQTGIPSTTSGLLIGLPSQPHDQSQILVSEPGKPQELGPGVAIVSSPSSLTHSSAVLAPPHGKKRPISRLPRKSKKVARSRGQPTLAPSEVGPSNVTLINLSSQQIAASIPGQAGGLVELGTLSASQRKVPNIIKRPKSGGVMYLDPTTLLQQRLSGSAQPGILSHDSSAHLLPCTVSGLNPNSSVLNVVSVPPSGSASLLAPGSVSLSTPVLSSADITGPISNLLFKANPHGLSLSDQSVVLQPAGGAPLMSQLGSSVQTSIASSICVLPTQQTITMAVNQRGEAEGRSVHLQHQSQPVSSVQTVDSNLNSIALSPSQSAPPRGAKGRFVGVFTQKPISAHSQSSRTTPISISSDQRPTNSAATSSSAQSSLEKSKKKVKRGRQTPDINSGKKLKASQAEDHQSNPEKQPPLSNPSSRELNSPEPMDTGKPPDKATNKSAIGKKKTPEGHALLEKMVGKDKPSAAGEAGSVPAASPPDQDGNSRDSGLDSKPKKGIIFEICSEDGFHIRCESIEEAWKSLTDKVKEARSNAQLKELSFEGVNGLRMLGVVHEAVVFLLEQLNGSRHCRSYRFRFHKPEETDEPPLNPHGSARAEIHHRRSVFDMFNFLASKHRQPPEYRQQEEEDEEGQLRTARRTSTELPLAVRFRQLKATSREAVGVYRSPIHGRGLFCKKTIEAGEMVIEYSGNVIRSVLTDKREKHYDGKGIGCYMFRIDDYEVVDATVHGNAARFINHSCEPNCYSRVVTVDGQKHIVIFASRRICCGEELTYDYKFPIEDANNKLLCNCGARKCRKFLN